MMIARPDFHAALECLERRIRTEGRCCRCGADLSVVNVDNLQTGAQIFFPP